MFDRKGLAVGVVLGLLVGAFLPSPAAADFRDGNELYEECRNRRGECAGVIMGMTDMLVFLSGRTLACVPPDATTGQLADIYAEHARANASRRHGSASQLYLEALTEAFPC